MRKTYVITTEYGRMTVDLTEAELEHVRRQYHGFVDVRVLPDFNLDFDAIAQELHDRSE